MRVAIVVNPIAGMGGRVGLKGTDGNVTEARARGAEPRAPDRAIRALEALQSRDPTIDVLAAPGHMGAREARAADVTPTVIGSIDPDRTTPPATTDAADTRAAVRAAIDATADVLLFVGGDGTATDVAETLDAAGVETPMLGVPAGVKVYSSVFAVSPEDAATILTTFEQVERREINDIDEQAYREGHVETDLRAVRPVPVAPELQASKQVGSGTVAGIAAGMTDEITPETTYVFGPGGTVQAIERELGIDGTPLGVDVWAATETGGELLVADATETEILEQITPPTVVIVSPIGGQGFVFGRGNQQLSPAVLAQADIEIVASREKLNDLDVLHIDIDDPTVAESLRGWRKVRVGRVERRMMKLV